MIFRPELAELVLEQRKTQTRRPVKDGAPCRYVAGRIYAVQDGRGRPARGRLQVCAVALERLGAIDDDDAQAEGFDDRAAFLAYWRELHGDVDLEQPVWAIRFRLAHRGQLPIPQLEQVA